MRVDQVDDAIGIISGSAAEADRQPLKNVAGVTAVEPDAPFHLPPPDAPVQ
jgi:hypothetical protein